MAAAFITDAANHFMPPMPPTLEEIMKSLLNDASYLGGNHEVIA